MAQRRPDGQAQSPVYLACIPDEYNEQLCQLAFKLPESLRQRIARARTQRLQNQTILGRALLAIALGALGSEIDIAALDCRSNGQPAIPEGLWGSISHSRHAAAAVASSIGSIGLDIEEVDNAAISGLPFTLEDWVGAEAIAKSSGYPLTVVLANLSRSATYWSVLRFRAGPVVGALAGSYTVALQPSAIWLSISEILKRIDRRAGLEDSIKFG